MKKLFVLLAVVALGASTASAQEWGAGIRIGSGFQGVAQKSFANENYIEARLGMDWMHSGVIIADFSALYVWNIANMDWTDTGNWFFDAGLGLNLGGKSHYATVGAQLMARLGYTFENSPISLALDWSPVLGAEIAYMKDFSESNFNERGIANFGLSCIFRF